MRQLLIRSAVAADLSRLTEIYNHYVMTSPATFDLEPLRVEQRMAWFRSIAVPVLIDFWSLMSRDCWPGMQAPADSAREPHTILPWRRRSIAHRRE